MKNIKTTVRTKGPKKLLDMSNQLAHKLLRSLT